MGNENNGEERTGLKKGPWTKEEDEKLLGYIREHGHGRWRSLPVKAGLQRCGKSCRLRWTNYLRPDIKRGKFSLQEEKSIIRLHALLGNRWSAIAAHLPKRTDNEIKNYWNTRLKKRLTRMGIDPATHRPKASPIGSGHSSHVAVVSHMAQWETARLEAEARLVRESKLLSRIQLLRRNSATTAVGNQASHTMAPPCLDVLKVWQATASHNGFFGPRSTSSARSMESPTSTLNLENEGKMGNSEEMMVHESSTTSYSMDYGNNVSGSLDLDPISDFNFMGCDYLQEFEETRSYWNNLLSSPMRSPVL